MNIGMYGYIDQYQYTYIHLLALPSKRASGSSNLLDWKFFIVGIALCYMMLSSIPGLIFGLPGTDGWLLFSHLTHSVVQYRNVGIILNFQSCSTP